MTDATDKPGWDELKELLRWFAALFGAPKDLYEDQLVRRKHGLVLRGWLCGLEAIARALLLAMAAALPKPEAAPRRAAKTSRRKTPIRRSTRPFTDSIAVGVIEVPDSERWADVSFVLIPPRPPERRARSKPAKPFSLMRTRPLAYRLEALIRVAERPEHYARRLAVRLHADRNVAFRLLRQPTPVGCESFPRDDVGRAQAFGWLALDRLQADTG